jgi:hypothetical protein
MKSSLDLNLLPVARQEGQEQPELPGLYAVTAPRRPARGRENDSLVIYLSMTGNSPIAAGQLGPLLERLAQKYYKTSGSVTAAMRTAAEGLNLVLLDRNLRSSSAGRQGIGRLALAVLHGEIMYLAHCGPLHTFLVTPQETLEFHDSQGGRGLGLSRTTTVRFYQAPLSAGDFLVCTPQLPPGWTTNSLRHSQRLSLDGMRRQLVDYAPREMESVLIQALPGEGRLRLLRRKPGLADMAHSTQPGEQPAEASAAPAEAGALPQPARTAPPAGEAPGPVPAPAGPEQAPPGPAPVEPERQAGLAGEQVPAGPAPTPTSPGPASASRPEIVARDGLRRTAPVHERPPAAPAARPPTGPAVVEKAPPRPARKPRRRLRDDLAPGLRVFGTLGSAVGGTLAAFLRSLGRLLRNILPDESVLHLPPSVMIFFALAVPLALSTIGGMMYAQRGRAAQYQTYYEQALAKAEVAVQQTGRPPCARPGASVGGPGQSGVLPTNRGSGGAAFTGPAALDGLDAIERLIFQQAVMGGLGDTIQIAGLVASDTDLYILNGAQGSVLRAIFTSNGYKIDTEFQCGPTYGPTIVGPLVDIVALPKGAVENATLLGMDASGSILYCIPGGKQPLTAARAPPNTGVGTPTAFDLDMGDLYVLDPDVNAVWIYRNMETRQQPRLFFGDDIPPMQDVIDLAVNNDDLYLLHGDGHITQCIYSGLVESPTRCEDPFPFTDPRPGRSSGRVIADTVFNQVYFAPPPDPSIYIDPNNQAIYHFSVRLALQRQYRAFERCRKAGDSLRSARQLVFIAIGHESNTPPYLRGLGAMTPRDEGQRSQDQILAVRPP